MGNLIFKTLLVKGAKGDKGETGDAPTVPAGGVIGWSGGTLPQGYENASSPTSWIKKVAEVPLTSIAKVIDSLANTANTHSNAPSIHAVNQALAAKESEINHIWETIYPVGSIYMSVNSTSPASLFGGTWVAIQEKFLLGAGSTHTAGSTGGAFSKSISVSGTSGATALTVNQMPDHNHYIAELSGTAAEGGAHTHTYYVTGFSQSDAGEGDKGSVSDEVWTGYQTGNQDGTGVPEGAHSHNVTTLPSYTGGAGSGKGHTHSISASGTNDITNPYLAVYMWKRTA